MSVVKDREMMRSDISAFCKKLVLSQRAVALCETETTPRQEEFLHRVLAEEMENRERSRRSRLLSKAGFPVYKTLEGYELHGVKLPNSLQWSDLTEGEAQLGSLWPCRHGKNAPSYCCRHTRM